MQTKKSQQPYLSLVLGIFVIMFGVLGIATLGAGIMFNLRFLGWFGGALTSVVVIVASTVEYFIR